MAKYCMTCGQELPEEAAKCSRCDTPCPDRGKNISPLHRITDRIISGEVQVSAASATDTAGQIAGGVLEKLKEEGTKVKTTGIDKPKLKEGSRLWIGVAAFALITIIGMILPFAADDFGSKMAMFHCAYSKQLALDSYIVLILSVAAGGLAMFRKHLPAMICSVIAAVTICFDMNQEAVRVFFDEVGRSVGYYVMMIGAIGLLICGVMNYLQKNKS